MYFDFAFVHKYFKQQLFGKHILTGTFEAKVYTVHTANSLAYDGLEENIVVVHHGTDTVVISL